MRNTMIQLREVNAKLASAQAAQAESEDKAKELQGKYDDLTKKCAAEKIASEKTIQDLKVQLANDDLLNTHLSDSLVKWKQGYSKLAEYAKATEGKRAEYASKCIIQDRRISDLQSRNAEMYRLASDVLDRYAQFGLGTAIAAREPFVGITKIKLQKLVQEYQNKLKDQTVAKESPTPDSKAENKQNATR